jgi:catechol 2,3-dioxygenase-like lactoylglutathione lyase family enzyme
MLLHHIALRVRDVESAAAFYAGVLRLEVLKRDEPGGELRSIWLRAGEAVLMLEKDVRGDGAGVGSGHLLAFAVDDLAAAERRLNEAGVKVADRTSFTLYVNDPDGHRVGLSTYRF